MLIPIEISAILSKIGFLICNFKTFAKDAKTFEYFAKIESKDKRFVALTFR